MDPLLIRSDAASLSPVQEVRPLAVTLPISEDTSVVSTPVLEIAPIQDLPAGSGAFAHALLTPEGADPRGGKPRSAYTLITPCLPGGNPVDDSNI